MNRTRQHEPGRTRLALLTFGIVLGVSASVLAQGGAAGGGAAGGAGAARGGAAGSGGFGGAGGPGSAGTPNGTFGNGSGAPAGNGVVTGFGFNNGGNLTNAPGNFSNVSGFNPYSGFNPGFNGGVNPSFGNSSGANTNFSFNPYNGYNPLLGNPAGITGFSGTPFGTNALLNSPFSANGFSNANFGSNPLIANPLSVTNAGNAGLGSNPLINSPVNAVAPGQVNNYTNNPALFNPAGNAAFSGDPTVIGTGQAFGQNGFPLNGNSNLLTNGANLNGYALNPGFTGGFGTSYASYGAYSGINSGAGYSGYPIVLYGSGYGGYYPDYGYGPGYAVGVTPYDVAMYRHQKSALNASRYNLNNARASAAYAAANFYNDLAATTVSTSYRTSTGIKPSYNINSGSPALAPVMRRHDAAQARSAMTPRDKLIDNEGRVLWPKSAPTSPAEVARARADVDDAVAVTAAEFSKDGRSTVRDVINAQEKVKTYASKAFEVLKSDHVADAVGLANFLASLDYALTSMGNAAHPVGPDRTRPENTPKTGGDVLKDSISRDKAADPKSQPAKPADAPKTSGGVLRDQLKSDATTKGSGR